jgi:hypothetical protein
MEDLRIRELDFFKHRTITYMCKARVGEMVIFNNEMVHESECERVTEPFKLSYNLMKSGAQLISTERREQMSKHKYNDSNDDEYVNGELKQAAIYALTCNDDVVSNYPKDWHPIFGDKCATKDEIGLLTVAGALIAAEIDRIRRLEEKENNF